jgi:hypothetical protein
MARHSPLIASQCPLLRLLRVRLEPRLPDQSVQLPAPDRVGRAPVMPATGRGSGLFRPRPSAGLHLWH